MAKRKRSPSPKASRSPSRGTWLRRPGEAADAEREELARLLAPHELTALGSYYWEGWARDAQLAPREAWRTWLICAGRGFGKTRAGAEWVREVARNDGSARIALVGASLTEVRNVMVEGDSGVLAAAPGALAPQFEPSLRKLTWENGAIAWLYSAGEPESLRGPQHSHARRPGTEGIHRQRSACAPRPPASLLGRRAGRRSSRRARRGRDVDRRRSADRSLGRPGRDAGGVAGGHLDLRPTRRGHARPRSRDTGPRALPRRMDPARRARKSHRRNHDRYASTGRDR